MCCCCCPKGCWAECRKKVFWFLFSAGCGNQAQPSTITMRKTRPSEYRHVPFVRFYAVSFLFCVVSLILFHPGSRICTVLCFGWFFLSFVSILSFLFRLFSFLSLISCFLFVFLGFLIFVGVSLFLMHERLCLITHKLESVTDRSNSRTRYLFHATN